MGGSGQGRPPGVARAGTRGKLAPARSRPQATRAVSARQSGRAKGRIDLGVEKVDSRVRGAQHTGTTGPKSIAGLMVTPARRRGGGGAARRAAGAAGGARAFL